MISPLAVGNRFAATTAAYRSELHKLWIPNPFRGFKHSPRNMQTLYYRWQIQMHSAITLILYGLANVAVPAARLANPFSPTSWQHVIGHKKLQLCINLWLRSLGAGNGRWAKGNRNETNRMKWPLWKGESAGNGKHGKGQEGQWRRQGQRRYWTLITTCHQILMPKTPLGRSTAREALEKDGKQEQDI